MYLLAKCPYIIDRFEGEEYWILDTLETEIVYMSPCYSWVADRLGEELRKGYTGSCWIIEAECDPDGTAGL